MNGLKTEHPGLGVEVSQWQAGIEEPAGGITDTMLATDTDGLAPTLQIPLSWSRSMLIIPVNEKLSKVK